MFCSSWGDDALWALGEIELERGHYGEGSRLLGAPDRSAAGASSGRRCSRRPAARPDCPSDDAPAARQMVRADSAACAPISTSCAATTCWATTTSAAPGAILEAAATARHPLGVSRLRALAMADIRARLMLVSIMEGSLRRAREELRTLSSGCIPRPKDGWPVATCGICRSAGRARRGRRKLARSRRSTDDWPTFAGAAGRHQDRRGQLRSWAGGLGADRVGRAADGRHARTRAVTACGASARTAQGLLSYHPVVADDLVLFNNQNKIFAFDAQDRRAGLAQRRSQARPAKSSTARTGATAAGRMAGGLGVPRFTMTVHDDKLYARMGSQVTSRPLESFDSRSGGYLVCLDLAAQGRVVWTIPDANERAARFDESGPSRARRWLTVATSTSPCAKATCGRKPTWPASMPRPDAGGGAR